MRRLSALSIAAVIMVVVLAPATSAATKCGTWRWPVKTLSDKAAASVNYTPKATTVDAMRSKPAPSSLSTDTPRIKPLEYRTWRLQAKLVEAKVEDDHDIHLVIAAPANGSHTMIVEFPDVSCNGAASSSKKAAMKKARGEFTAACGDVGSSSFVHLKGKATITGVGFWDELHGQTGVAPNGIELHPVLSFAGTCQQT